MTQVES